MSVGTLEMINGSLEEDGNFEESRWSNLALEHRKYFLLERRISTRAE